MHFSNLVIIKKIEPGDDIEKAIQRAMGPGEENGGFWDWYQIGGRWTGFFDDYEPCEDPENFERCWLCEGAGKRNDEVGKAAREKDPSYTCNGCDGKGDALKWPTKWKRYEGDSISVAQLQQKHIDEAYRVVLEYRGAFAEERYVPWGKIKFQKQEKPSLDWIKKQFKDGIAIIVDNHN